MEDKLRDFARWGVDTRDWSAQTRKQYTGRVRASALWLHAHGNRRLEQATADDLMEWLSTLPPSPPTRNHARKALVAYCAWLIATRRRSDDPSTDIRSLRVRRAVPKALDPGDATKVWRAAQTIGPRAAALVAVMLFGGLRATEARTLQRIAVEGAWLRFAGKGGVQRMVPLHPTAAVALQRWMVHSPSPVWVFPSPTYPCDPLSYETVRQLMHDLGDLAGVDGMTAHRCRHSFATGLLEGGADLATVQLALGHASPNTTAGYLTVRPGRVEAAVARLDYGSTP